MDARGFANNIHYLGQERAARKLLLADGRVSAEKLAIMSDLEIYTELLKDYVFISASDEQILIINKKDENAFNKMAVWLSR